MEDFAQFDQWDDLQLDGWGIWQNSRFFRFGTDGVLLSDFARCKKSEKVIDLCSGTGIVPFMMMAKGQVETGTALEIQPYLCRLLERSAQRNGCADRFAVLEGDLCNIRSLAKGGSFDTVTVNPPYEPMGRGVPGQNPHRELARREVACSLEDIIAASAYLLKPEGRLVMVHRPFRLQELMSLLSKYHFSASRLQFVLGHEGERPCLFLLEAILRGRRELVTEPPFILHRADGEMSEELLKIYRKER